MKIRYHKNIKYYPKEALHCYVCSLYDHIPRPAVRAVWEPAGLQGAGQGDPHEVPGGV